MHIITATSNRIVLPRRFRAWWIYVASTTPVSLTSEHITRIRNLPTGSFPLPGVPLSGAVEVEGLATKGVITLYGEYTDEPADAYAEVLSLTPTSTEITKNLSSTHILRHLMVLSGSPVWVKADDQILTTDSLPPSALPPEALLHHPLDVPFKTLTLRSTGLAHIFIAYEKQDHNG